MASTAAMPVPCGFGDYDGALARIPELEVNLARAVTALEQAHKANATLRDVHTDLVNKYKQLQEQDERLCVQVRREREDQKHLRAEHQEQKAAWMAQMEANAKKFEDARAKLLSAEPNDLDKIKLQLVEETKGPLQQRVWDLESRLNVEQRKGVDAHRHAELMKVQNAQREEDFQAELSEHASRHKQKVQALERKIAALEVDKRRLADEAAAARQVRVQLLEQEAKVSRLQQEMEEHEQQSARESAAAAEELRTRIEDAAVARRRAHDLEVQINQSERRRQALQAEAIGLRREKDTLVSRVEHAEAQVRLAEDKPGTDYDLQMEIAQIRNTLASEREKHVRELRTAEENYQASAATARRNEARAKQAEEELSNQLRESQREQSETERRFQAEIASQRALLQAAEQDAELKRQAWREREMALLRQVDSANGRAESLSDEVSQCQMEKDDLQELLRETRSQEQQREQASHQRDQQREQIAQQREHQIEQAAKQREYQLELAAKQREQQLEQAAVQREQSAQAELQQREQAADTERVRHAAELGPLRDRAERAERERSELSAAVEACRMAARKEEKRADSLQTELAVVSQRLDDERTRWAREADERHSASIQAEEQRRAVATQKMQEEHRRLMAKHQAAAKSAFQKCARKRQELRSKCHELARRVAQLQHEKATAVRLCEENKSAYELRLAELGLASGIPSCGMVGRLTDSVSSLYRSESLGVSASRKEFRGISERLERHAEWLRSSRNAAGCTDCFSSISRGAPVVTGDEGMRASSISIPQGR
eukprot:TRINITY_DN54559_c0_g1_i1.p1 TRINITY_DN54559_c0_g1~~TRINITY_DN54559_c0_g1_i1.p1  ORF type:complete len:801 (+),score=180.03 TRINITY_DN54559_c0_g1_i1:62-2404(+)